MITSIIAPREDRTAPDFMKIFASNETNQCVRHSCW